MCDSALIAAILEELGYFDEKKEKNKNQEVHEKGSAKDSSRNSREEEQQEKQLIYSCVTSILPQFIT